MTSKNIVVFSGRDLDFFMCALGFYLCNIAATNPENQVVECTHSFQIFLPKWLAGPRNRYGCIAVILHLRNMYMMTHIRTVTVRVSNRFANIFRPLRANQSPPSSLFVQPLSPSDSGANQVMLCAFVVPKKNIQVIGLIIVKIHSISTWRARAPGHIKPKERPHECFYVFVVVVVDVSTAHLTVATATNGRRTQVDTFWFLFSMCTRNLHPCVKKQAAAAVSAAAKSALRRRPARCSEQIM